MTSELSNRLRGRYPIGTDGEYGERDFSSFIPPIALEAADRIEELEEDNKILDDALTKVVAEKLEVGICLDMAASNLNFAIKRAAKYEAALTRLRDCDWTITLPDRMDAVREIAREALSEGVSRQID